MTKLVMPELLKFLRGVKKSLIIVMFVIISIFFISEGAIGALIYNFICAHENIENIHMDTANTFIVFTTLIFIAMTAVMTLGGFILMHKLSSNEEKSILILIDKFLNKITDNEYSEKLVSKIFEEDHIRSNIEENVDLYIKSKLDEIVRNNRSKTEAASNLVGYFNAQKETQ